MFAAGLLKLQLLDLKETQHKWICPILCFLKPTNILITKGKNVMFCQLIKKPKNLSQPARVTQIGLFFLN